MRRLVRTRRRALTAVAVLVAATGLASPARAAVSCSFSAGVATVTIDGEDTATIVRSGDEIQVDGVQCGSATVTTTATVRFDGNVGFGEQAHAVIDLSGGPFAPGTGADDAFPEIEFDGDLQRGTVTVQGTTDDDVIVVGNAGMNLNAEEDVDVDVDVDGVVQFGIDGGAGNDVLRADGGAGTGSKSTIKVTIDGGEGDDLVAGSGASDILAGGDGTDTVDYAAATTSAFIDLKGGKATTNVGTDTLSGFENVNGSPAGDTITGTSGPNVLKGLGSNDVFIPLGGDDVVVGGPGTDRLELATSADVVVNLKKKVARGEGNDVVRGIEDVTTGRGDDRITGTNKRNRLIGGRGNDTLIAGGGDDYLRGEDGNDTMKGGSGDDQLYAGDGRDRLYGGPGFDSCPTSNGADIRVGCEIP